MAQEAAYRSVTKLAHHTGGSHLFLVEENPDDDKSKWWIMLTSKALSNQDITRIETHQRFIAADFGEVLRAGFVKEWPMVLKGIRERGDIPGIDIQTDPNWTLTLPGQELIRM